jgi:localization factor PodJL
MLRSITVRLDDMRTADSPAGFGEIEGQLAALHARLESHPGGQSDIEGLQRAVGDLLGEMRGAREAAVAAARDAAREFIATTGASSPANDVSEIRQRQEVSDRRVQMTLEAVNTALERIVDRLGALEAGVAAVPATVARPGHLTAGHVTADHVTADHVTADHVTADRLAPAVAAPPGPFPGEARRVVADDLRATEPAATPPPAPQPHPEMARPAAEAPRGSGRDSLAAEERLLLDELIEPGAGRPDPAVRVRRDAPDLAAAPAGGDPMSVIAAARRARMVATAGEAGRLEVASEGRADRLAAGKALASGVGAALATHRRSLLIGVAGLVVVLGLIKVASDYLGSRSAGVPQASITAVPADKPASAPAVSPPPAAVPVNPPAAPEPRTQRPASDAKPDGDWEDLLAPSRQEGARRTSQAPAGFVPAPGAVSADPAPLVTGSIPPQAVPAAPLGPIVHSDVPTPFAGLALGDRAGRAEPAAMLEVGIRLGEGRGIARDVEAAARWFERGAEKGFAPAQFRLASAYEKGVGVKRDLAAAKTWYARAAEAGNARAMHNLAVLVAEGVDGKPDYAEASRWFVQAAESGVRDSQYNLGILAARGLGVPQDLEASYRWFAIAAASGDQDASTKRDEVGRRLTPAARQRADALVKAFRPREAVAAANDVPAPAGGWDAVIGKSGAGAKVKTTRL